MSPTVFDSSAKQREEKHKQLQNDLAQMVEQKKQGKTKSSPPLVEAKEAASPDIEQDVPLVEQPESAPRRQPTDYSEVMRDVVKNGLNSVAFAALPQNVAFESQHSNERILLVLRQHPIVNVVWIFLTFLLILIPFFIFPIIPIFDLIPSIYGFFTMLGWFLFVTAFVIESFLSWYFNIYIITDERIIDIDFYSLLYKEVSEAKLEKIEDVTAATAGVWGSVFNFGNISIQTAGERNKFEFLRVPQPARVTKFLNELLIEEEQEKLDGRAI